MATSAHSRMRAPGSLLIDDDGARPARPDDVVELARHADGHVQGRGHAVPGDADLAGPGQPLLVGHLARGAELGPEHLEQRVEVAVLRRAATPWPHAPPRSGPPGGPRRRRRARRSTTRTRAARAHRHARRPAGRLGPVAGRAGAGRRVAPSPSARRSGSVMAATRLPPKAGFHATSRPSSTPKPTASPVRPAPRRAGARAATSRPHRVPGTSTAQGAPPRTSRPGPRPRPLRPPCPATDTHTVGAPRGELEAVGQLGADGHHGARHALGQVDRLAQQLAGQPAVGRARCTTATTGVRAAPAAPGAGRGHGVDVGLRTSVGVRGAPRRP